MAINTTEFNRLKRQLKDLQSDVDRADGALEETMKSIESEFDCTTIEEAEKLLEKLEAEAERLDKEFADQLEEFKEDWEDSL